MFLLRSHLGASDDCSERQAVMEMMTIVFFLVDVCLLTLGVVFQMVLQEQEEEEESSQKSLRPLPFRGELRSLN